MKKSALSGARSVRSFKSIISGCHPPSLWLLQRPANPANTVRCSAYEGGFEIRHRVVSRAPLTLSPCRASMTMPLPIHKAAQHGVHAALPAATGALEELEHVRVKAHRDLALILSWPPHQLVAASARLTQSPGTPCPGGIVRHVRREFVLGLGGDRRPNRFCPRRELPSPRAPQPCICCYCLFSSSLALLTEIILQTSAPRSVQATAM